jgi:hypothetical protein
MKDMSEVGKNSHFWLKWSGATAIAAAVAVLAVTWLLPHLPGTGFESGFSEYVSNMIFGVAVGLPFGIAQMLLLRRAIWGTDWWVISWMLGWGQVFIRTSSEIEGLRFLVVFAIAGTVQWVVLRLQVPGARWWIPVSILAIVPAGFMAFIVALSFGRCTDHGLGLCASGAVTGWIAGAAVYGALTGFALQTLLD